VSKFKDKSSVPNLHPTAQRLYATFNSNRTAELYTFFFGLVGGVPDYSGSKFSKSFTACVPFPGEKNRRQCGGMAKGGLPHGLVRFEYKKNIIEETRLDGNPHGLRVVCTQLGDIWIRFYSKGQRLAQIVMSPSGTIASSPKPVDEGGLKKLQSHLSLIVNCFKNKAK
jgi:hypothetical protein